MPQETPVTRRTKLFFTAAAAALTLAAGLTVGALLGFVRPPEAASGAASGPVETATAPPPAAANDATPSPEGEPVLAAEPRGLEREREEGREHGEREHPGRGQEEREEDDDD